MKGSIERIGFIIEYISAYESKIKLANKCGLFDEAHLFELFALKICELWYGKKFLNLNTIKKNYPCVDLISDDGTVYVQVSTQTDIMSKIRGTLQALDKSNAPELANVTSPVFFVLSQESESSVKDFTVGKYSFVSASNLISTDKIVEKAKVDTSFQTALYEILKSDIEGLSDIADKLLKLFDDSKNVGLLNIITTINGEYEINRTELIRQIETEKHQFSIVCGEAGCGKSVICKKILEDAERVLFARADRLIGCHSIDEIWGIDVSKSFELLQGKKVVIYLDALEYIASAKESTKEILQSLLNEIKKHPNISFLTSCRSCDVGAFIKLFGLFDIKKYVVENISDEELKGLCKKYPVIREMASSGKYAELIRSPFYINVIVSKRIDLTEASDVNAFRTFIWRECICLSKMASEKNISSSEIVQTIKILAIERSKRFSVGIPEEEIDQKILEFLRSNGVVTEKGYFIRLKYDIYEDICFEHFFDIEFDASKAVYSCFFESIEKMGIGVYRRYQIWISNKLLARENRDKFLQALVFDSKVSLDWHRNTVIGLIRSPFCKSFFDEQEANIVDEKHLDEFVEIANCFGFEMGGVSYNKLKSICRLECKASGYGRPALISLIHKNEIYKSKASNKSKYIKLCNDYALRSKPIANIDECVCDIATYYVQEYIDNVVPELCSDAVAYLSPMLEIIYSFPKVSTIWIDRFWEKLKAMYVDENDKRARIGEEILNWTIEHITLPLVDEKIEGLLGIATTLWTEENARDKRRSLLYSDARINDDSSWGLHGAGEDYNYKHRSIEEDIFLRVIFQRKLKPALEWTISIINKMVSEHVVQKADEVKIISLYDNEEKIERQYAGSGRMWFAGREESMLPTLIGDLVYWVKESSIQILHICEKDKELFEHLAQYIKKQIFESSTSVILFPVIEDIGFEFFEELPGYAIDLASSLDVIAWDIQWQVHNMESPAKTILMEQIKLSMGIPDLAGRYPKREFNYTGIQDYMACCQLFGEETLNEQCIGILEYLYDKNDKNNPHTLLQIQKMDMRHAKYKKHGENLYSVEPQLTDETQRIVDENEGKNQPERDVLCRLKNVLDKGTSDNLELVLQSIDVIKELMTGQEETINLENYYIMFISLALKNPALSQSRRTELVCEWIDRIENVFSHKNSYVSDLRISVVLFEQYRNEIDTEAKRKLKKIILACLIDCSSDGQIGLLRRIIVDTLMGDTNISRVFFNTIIGLAKDEWKHNEYNKRVLHKNRNRSYCISGGGFPKPDDIVRALGLEAYKSSREEIINRFLYDEENLDVSALKFNELDPGYLFLSMGTGLGFDNEEFYFTAKKMIPIFVKSMNKEDTESIMDTYYQRLIVKQLFEKELTDENGSYKRAIDLLFDDVDFSMFGIDTIKMYVSLFEKTEAIYFDSFKKPATRLRCQSCIEYAETKIESIDNGFVRKGLERILIFDTDRMGSDWNKCETHYSYMDKLFLCKMWEKYYANNHEKEVIDAIYQMKIGELLPEVLPVVSMVVTLLKNRQELTGEHGMIINTLVLKSLLDFSENIKSDNELHLAYEKILNNLIELGDESAAVILDEYRLH